MDTFSSMVRSIKRAIFCDMRRKKKLKNSKDLPGTPGKVQDEVVLYPAGVIQIFSLSKREFPSGIATYKQDPLMPSTFKRTTDFETRKELYEEFEPARRAIEYEDGSLRVDFLKPSSDFLDLQRKLKILGVVPNLKMDSIVVKRVSLGDDEDGAQEAYHDAIIGYYLNRLRYDPFAPTELDGTQIPRSPNFAFYLDFFKVKFSGKPHQVILSETAGTTSIDKFIDGNMKDMSEKTIIGLLAQFLHAMEVGFRMYGLILNDGHPGNILVKNLEKTDKLSEEEKNKYWRFDLPLDTSKGRHSLYIPPDAHLNRLVQIIDPGRMRMQVPFHRADEFGYSFSKTAKYKTRVYVAQKAIDANQAMKPQYIKQKNGEYKLDPKSINRGTDLRRLACYLGWKIELTKGSAELVNLKRVLIKMTCLDLAPENYFGNMLENKKDYEAALDEMVAYKLDGVFERFDIVSVKDKKAQIKTFDKVLREFLATLQKVSNDLKRVVKEKQEESPHWSAIYDELFNPPARSGFMSITPITSYMDVILRTLWVHTDIRVKRTPLELLVGDSAFATMLIPPSTDKIRYMAKWYPVYKINVKDINKEELTDLKRRNRPYTPLEKKIS